MPTVWSITERTEANVVILHPSVCGLSVEQPPDRQRLFTSIDDHVRDGYSTILINLRDAHYMDSDGLGEIVRGFTRARKAGGALAVCELVPKVRDLFAITRLDIPIAIFQTEVDGIQALKESTSVQP